MRLSVNEPSSAPLSGHFPRADLTDTIYTTPVTNVLLAELGYGSYDYCSMPHPKSTLYATIDDAQLVYVEYVQRHQRRTPYNLLPDDAFDCSDSWLAAGTNFVGNYGSVNIVIDNSTIGSCQYPQLTSQGMLDGVQHGKDLWDVYGEQGILPRIPDDSVGFRTSNSMLTESSALHVLRGIWPGFDSITVHQQSANVDSVNAGFDCATRDDIFDQQKAEPAWVQHLEQFNATFQQFNLSGAWVSSLDHLCDNFQAKICNGYPLDVEKSTINSVFAGGDWEWDFAWRASPTARNRTITTEGLFIKEIVERLQAPEQLKYWHTFAHDGDVGPLAGALGISYLRWPGMASNIAIEVWERSGVKFVRVLYCGAPLRSSWVQPEHDLNDFVAKLGNWILDINTCEI